MKKIILFGILIFSYLLNYAQFVFKDGGGTIDVYANGELKTSFQKAGLTITYAGNVMSLRQDTRVSFSYQFSEIDTPAYSTIDSVVATISGWISTYGDYWAGNGNYVYLTTQTDSVGLGISIPTHKLHVVGDGYFSTNLTVNGSFGIGNKYISGFTDLDSITSNIGNVITAVPNIFVDTISDNYLIIDNDSVVFTNAAAQFHRVDSLNINVANTWLTVKMDTLIGNETTYGFKFNADRSKIIATIAGLIRVQGCVHYKFYGTSTTQAKLYTRILIDGVEARCLQTNTDENRFQNATGFQEFIGTITTSVGSTIELQVRTDNINLDLEGDTVFDNPVSASINFEYISKK